MSKEKEGKAHIPSWINPELEESWRFVGSGFGDKALWRETVPLISEPEATAPTPEPSATTSPEMGIMDRIKIMLSEHMGVRPDFIEVDVRVKL